MTFKILFSRRCLITADLTFSEPDAQSRTMQAYNQIILASRPKGPPTSNNFRLETGPIPDPGDGQNSFKNKIPISRSLHARPDERR